MLHVEPRGWTTFSSHSVSIALMILLSFIQTLFYTLGSLFSSFSHFFFICKALQWCPLIIWKPSSFLSLPDLSEPQWRGGALFPPLLLPWIILNEGFDDFADFCLPWNIMVQQNLTFLLDCWLEWTTVGRVQSSFSQWFVYVCECVMKETKRT